MADGVGKDKLLAKDVNFDTYVKTQFIDRALDCCDMLDSGHELGNGDAYRLSKAAANAYTRHLAWQIPDLVINSFCPGLVKTKLSAERLLLLTGGKTAADAGKSPEEATPVFMYLLFADPVPYADVAQLDFATLPKLKKLPYDPKNGVNGWFYGPDAVRSPWHCFRRFGDLPYTPKDFHEGHKEPYYRTQADKDSGHPVGPAEPVLELLQQYNSPTSN
jgi:hypothetical protein